MTTRYSYHPRDVAGVPFVPGCSELVTIAHLPPNGLRMRHLPLQGELT